MKPIHILFFLLLTASGNGDILIYDGQKLPHEIKGKLQIEKVTDHPSAKSALVFRDPHSNKASAKFDLQAFKLQQSGIQQIQFDLKTEIDVVEVSCSLHGFPSGKVRRYYFKRFERLGEWDSVVLDIGLDDDGHFKRLKTDGVWLKMNFHRPAYAKHESDGKATTASITNIRAVDPDLKIKFLHDQAKYLDTNDTIRITYPLVIENRTEKDLNLQWVHDENHLKIFSLETPSKTLSLSPKGKREERVTLVVTKSQLKGLGPGYCERIKVGLQDTGNRKRYFGNRGYRPIYCYGVIMPEIRANSDISNHRLQKIVTKIWELNRELNRDLDFPLDITPRYQDFFRCKSCRYRMEGVHLTTYRCRNSKCKSYHKEVKGKKGDNLYAAYLGIYHAENSRYALAYTKAYLKHKNDDYLNMAKAIINKYAKHYRELPILGASSTGYHCRLTSSTLFEKHNLEDFADTYLLMKNHKLMNEKELLNIHKNLLDPLMYSVNLHSYAISSGQVGFGLSTLKAGYATKNPFYFADALAGDGGLMIIMQKAFDRDGIGIEGGAYARSAAERILQVQGVFELLQIAYDKERMEQIIKNSSALGYLKGRSLDESISLLNSGFTILQLMDGTNKLRASINWRNQRERGEHDLLAFYFGDKKGSIASEVGRIAYAVKESFWMKPSLAHTIPVVNEKDISMFPFEQSFFEHSKAWSGMILKHHAEHRPYPDTRFQRALLLIPGGLIVFDQLSADSAKQIDLAYYMTERLLKSSTPFKAMKQKLGKSKAYSLPTDLQVSQQSHSRAEFDFGRNRLLIRSTPFHVIRGKIKSGFLMKDSKDFMMIRSQQQHWNCASLYALNPKHTSSPIEDLAPVESERAETEYLVTYQNGSKLKVHLSTLFNSKAYFKIEKLSKD